MIDHLQKVIKPDRLCFGVGMTSCATPQRLNRRAPPPIISFVVETANTRPGEYRDLFTVIAALSGQSLLREELEFLVVTDPQEHPGLGEQVGAVPGAPYFAQKNLGARHARGAIVGFSDSDCLPGPDWGASVLEAFAHHDRALAVVMGLIEADHGLLPSAF